MYSPFQIAKKYIQYYIHAANGKGHGLHSPFVFDFVKNVLNDKKEYECYKKIETQRKKLLSDNREIEVEDFGAGSVTIKTNKRIVKRIAATSLKPKKYAQLLFRIAKYYKAQRIVELGTSLGITTSYLTAAPNAKVYTLEGAKQIADIASESFRATGSENIKLITGSFETSLPLLIQQLPQADLIFIDGNHKRVATITYFEQLLKISNHDTILIFDDIHWSEEMEAAWEQIKQHVRVTMTIDLFFIGIVLMRREFKVKQHFTIRF